MPKLDTPLLSAVKNFSGLIEWFLMSTERVLKAIARNFAKLFQSEKMILTSILLLHFMYFWIGWFNVSNFEI